MRRIGGTERFDEQIGLIAALGEPVRRALYRYVVAQPEPVGREQAASAIGVARHVAKFHLDKLEADGLLETEYSRPPGRRGPGAGRPAKRYRRAARDVSVSLPERRYDLAGRVMAQAITAAAKSGAPIADAIHEAATVEGRDMGELARARLGEDPNEVPRSRVVSHVLAEHGYEPRVTDDGITLVNCPFHSLAREHTDLVCGMNLELIRGLLETCDGSGLHARLDPAPGQCCVTLDRRRLTQSEGKANGR
jgi:predicted ArsR family transcriptional regulator